MYLLVYTYRYVLKHRDKWICVCWYVCTDRYISWTKIHKCVHVYCTCVVTDVFYNYFVRNFIFSNEPYLQFNFVDSILWSFLYPTSWAHIFLFYYNQVLEYIYLYSYNPIPKYIYLCFLIKVLSGIYLYFL